MNNYSVQSLILMKEAFEAAGYTFWLDYGTFLCALCEKDFMGHDDGAFYIDEQYLTENYGPNYMIKHTKKFYFKN